MEKNFQPFYDRPETIEYKSSYIGNNYGPEYEIKKSTFNSVSEYSDVNTMNNIVLIQKFK